MASTQGSRKIFQIDIFRMDLARLSVQKCSCPLGRDSPGPPSPGFPPVPGLAGRGLSLYVMNQMRCERSVCLEKNEAHQLRLVSHEGHIPVLVLIPFAFSVIEHVFPCVTSEPEAHGLGGDGWEIADNLWPLDPGKG